MRLIEVINENCSKGAMREELLKAIHTLKPFSHNDMDVPFQKLERLAGKYMEKYAIGIQWIHMSARDGRTWLSAEVSWKAPYKPHVLLNASSMYELFAKACLAMSMMVESGSAMRWEQLGASATNNGPESSPPNSGGKKGEVYESIVGSMGRH